MQVAYINKVCMVCMSCTETLKVLNWFTAIVNNNMTGVTRFVTPTNDLFHRAPIFTVFLHITFNSA
jgi:hypothetical protein